MNSTYLSFNIGKEVYAINTEKVLEVLQHQTITVVPNSPEYLVGIVNFRGDGIPVIDARVQFNLVEKVAMNKAFIIVADLIFENESIRAGVVVDKVKSVITINNSEILDVPPMKSQFNIEFIVGIVNYGDDFLMILNMERVFSHDQADHLKQIDTNI